MACKLFIFCLGLLIANISASSLCKCGPEEKDSVAKYTFKMSENGTDYDEDVEIDEEKGTEIFHVPKISADKDSGDFIYDFKKNLTMIRVTEAKACFLSKSTFDEPTPAELLKLLELVTRNGITLTPRTEVKLKVASTLDDRSELSDEMANLCAKLPIYEVVEGEVDLSGLNQPTTASTDMVQRPGLVQPLSHRVKRGWVRQWVCRLVCSVVCKTSCSYVCGGVLCSWICRPVCNNVCKNVCGWVDKWVG